MGQKWTPRNTKSWMNRQRELDTVTEEQLQRHIGSARHCNGMQYTWSKMEGIEQHRKMHTEKYQMATGVGRTEWEERGRRHHSS